MSKADTLDEGMDLRAASILGAIGETGDEDAGQARAVPAAGSSEEPSAAEVEAALNKLDSPSPEGDAAAGETPPSGDDNGQPEPAPEPAIEPPASWSKEWKERFKTLPRETQSFVAERERERDAATNRALQDAAEARKSADGIKANVDAQTQQFSTQLAQELQRQADHLNQVIKAVVDSDPVLARANDGAYWSKLSTENPAEYTRQREELNQRTAKVRTALQSRDQLAAQGQQAFQASRAQYLAQQNAALLDRIPEWKADASKARTELGEVLDYGRTKYGVDPGEVHASGDHRIPIVLRGLMLAERENTALKAEIAQMKTAKEATLKSAQDKRTPPPAPRVATPRGGERSPPDNQALRQAKQRAFKTGRIDDQIDAVLNGIGR